eukprot:42864-Hanusia_phi.AAC.1
MRRRITNAVMLGMTGSDRKEGDDDVDDGTARRFLTLSFRQVPDRLKERGKIVLAKILFQSPSLPTEQVKPGRGEGQMEQEVQQ